MQGLTLGEIGSWLALIAGIISSVGIITKVMTKYHDKALQEALKPILEKMDAIIENEDNIDRNVCKNYVVEYLGEEERDVKHTEEETRLFWENYDRYTQKGGNSYVKEKVEVLKKQGKM